jgi:hypothetical protein
LATRVIRVRVDFIHFPLIYYFHAGPEGARWRDRFENSLISRIAALQPEWPESIRLGASMLRIALSDVAGILNSKFVRHATGNKPGAVFDAVRRDHLESDRPDE